MLSPFALYYPTSQQLEVFSTDDDGAVKVTWKVQNENWNPPYPLTEPGFRQAGTPLAGSYYPPTRWRFLSPATMAGYMGCGKRPMCSIVGSRISRSLESPLLDPVLRSRRFTMRLPIRKRQPSLELMRVSLSSIAFVDPSWRGSQLHQRARGHGRSSSLTRVENGRSVTSCTGQDSMS